MDRKNIRSCSTRQKRKRHDSKKVKSFQKTQSKACVPDQTSLNSLTFKLLVLKIHFQVSPLACWVLSFPRNKRKQHHSSSRHVPFWSFTYNVDVHLPVKAAQATHLSSAMGGAHSQVGSPAVALCIGHYPPAAVPPLPHPLLLLSSRTWCCSGGKFFFSHRVWPFHPLLSNRLVGEDHQEEESQQSEADSSLGAMSRSKVCSWGSWAGGGRAPMHCETRLPLSSAPMLPLPLFHFHPVT